MTTRQSIATADQLYAGRGYEPALYTVNLAKGRPVNLLTKFDLGTPTLAVAAGIINTATGAELPNATTITYQASSSPTAPLDAVAPLTKATITTVDGAVTVWTLDTPRNLTLAVTHDSAVVATTVTITGYDRTMNKIVKTMTATVGGTSKTDATTATFKYVKSIAITSAGNATTNTLSVGFGDVLGLPYRLTEKEDLIVVFLDGASDAATVVVASTATASATSGDTRGTIDCSGALNGSKKVKGWMYVQDDASRAGLLGITQYAG
jgi:hypothetical protein